MTLPVDGSKGGVAPIMEVSPAESTVGVEASTGIGSPTVYPLASTTMLSAVIVFESAVTSTFVHLYRIGLSRVYLMQADSS